MSTLIQELTAEKLSQLQDALKREEYARTPEDVQAVFVICQALVQGIGDSWQRINQLLDEGVEGRGLRLLLSELNDVVTIATSGLPRIGEKVKSESPPFQGKEEILLALGKSTDRVGKIRAELEALRSSLPTSPPQVDPKLFAGAGGVKKAEDYISFEEGLARIQSPRDQ